MSIAEDLLKKSAKEIAKEIGGGNPGSPTEYVRITILNYKLQSRLIIATWCLVMLNGVLIIISLR